MRENVLELLRIQVRCDRAAAAAVRHSVSRLGGLGWVIGDAMLVASELVTNAVTYAGCDPDHWLDVRVGREDDGILISVRDPGRSRGPAASWSASAPAGNGLGLVIVDALARRWGSDRDQGYHVWAELAEG